MKLRLSLLPLTLVIIGACGIVSTVLLFFFVVRPRERFPLIWPTLSFMGNLWPASLPFQFSLCLNAFLLFIVHLAMLRVHLTKLPNLKILSFVSFFVAVTSCISLALLALISVENNVNVHNVFAGIFFLGTFLGELKNFVLYIMIKVKERRLNWGWVVWKSLILVVMIGGTLGMIFFIIIYGKWIANCPTDFSCPDTHSIGAICQQTAILCMFLFISTLKDDLAEMDCTLDLTAGLQSNPEETRLLNE
jgi:hypothetical protein